MKSYNGMDIYEDPGIFGGRPTIGDHRVTVHDIVALFVQGEPINEIAADFELMPPEVDAALAYYQDHKSGIDCELVEDQRITTDLAARDRSPAAERLRAAWNEQCAARGRPPQVLLR